MIDASADDYNALSDYDRKRQEAKILADVLAVEREEAELVWRAQAEGLTSVGHRPDSNPQAVLGVEVVAS